MTREIGLGGGGDTAAALLDGARSVGASSSMSIAKLGQMHHRGGLPMTETISRFTGPRPGGTCRGRAQAHPPPGQEKAGFAQRVPDAGPIARPFRAFFDYHDAPMEGRRPPTKAEREMIVVAASSAAGQCLYLRDRPWRHPAHPCEESRLADRSPTNHIARPGSARASVRCSILR